MTFSKAGVFKYMCAIHRPLGMTGSVTVTERKVNQVASFSPGAKEFPEGLAVDRQGNIYVGMAPRGRSKKSLLKALPAPSPLSPRLDRG